MPRFIYGFSIILLSYVSLTLAGDLADQSTDVDNETFRLTRELQQIQTQRRNNQRDMLADQSDFAAYRASTAKRMASARADVDSLKRETLRNQTRGDSLASLIQSAQLKKHEIELSREALRNHVLKSCDDLDLEACRLAPQTQGQIRSSLSLVKNDLATKTIECPEAFSRLAQIISLMRDATGSIQTSSENSPIADIRGTATRLRIGCLMEAVAGLKGNVCYVWAGNKPDGAPVWKPAGDNSIGPEIIHAVAVREGKALPTLVDLPLTASGKGGQQ
ncbi:MAG: DUF3450 family protein [Chitinivibrionales bacterium]